VRQMSGLLEMEVVKKGFMRLIFPNIAPGRTQIDPFCSYHHAKGGIVRCVNGSGLITGTVPSATGTVVPWGMNERVTLISSLWACQCTIPGVAGGGTSALCFRVPC
jgi:hypothetical protein